MEFEEKLKYLEENYDGISSMAYYNAQGGVKCKTMSWFCYLSCIEELIKIFREHPEKLNNFGNQKGVSQ